jgi:hypothetical protein
MNADITNGYNGPSWSVSNELFFYIAYIGMLAPRRWMRIFVVLVPVAIGAALPIAHTQEGKARSRMNALRHGFASAAQTPAAGGSAHFVRGDAASAYECFNAVDLARSKLLNEIDNLLQQPASETLHKAVRRLGALQRYAARHFREIKNLTQKLE